MAILTSENKINSGVSSDVSVEQMINSLNIGFLPGKAIEAITEMGVAGNGLKEHESILNAIYYLIGELEENHPHEKAEWAKSNVLLYIQSLTEE